MKPDSNQHPLRVGLISLGCAKNLVDAEIMLGALMQAGVEVTNDYSHAKVFYTTLSGTNKQLQEGLDRAAGFLRSKLAHVMKLRIIPQLHFIYDESIERGSQLSQLIDQAIASDSKLIKE